MVDTNLIGGGKLGSPRGKVPSKRNHLWGSEEVLHVLYLDKASYKVDIEISEVLST